MSWLDGTPRVLVGLVAGDMVGAPLAKMSPAHVRTTHGDLTGPVPGSGDITEGAQLALCVLEAHPADAGLEPRVLDACHEWLAAEPPSVGVLTRQALETSGVEAWQASGRQACGNGALVRAPASVAAGRSGPALLAESVVLAAITHADPRSLVCCSTACLALRALVNGTDYDQAWLDAHATVASADVAALVAALGSGYAVEVRDRLEGAHAEVRGAVRGGLSGVSAGSGGYAVSTLQTAIAAGRGSTWAEGVLAVVREGDDADSVGALTGAILAARGLLPPSDWLAGIRCAARWPAWPADAVGPQAVERIERACRRAAGVVEPEGYPEHVPPFVVRRVHSQILYGRNPVFAREVAGLAEAGVTHVIDLRESWEWQGPDRLGSEAVVWLEEHELARLHLATPDGGAPTLATLDQAVAGIDAALAGGGAVFVHCRAGQERTGAVLLAWMLTRGGDLDGLRDIAPSLRPLPNQQAAVYEWLRARF